MSASVLLFGFIHCSHWTLILLFNIFPTVQKIVSTSINKIVESGICSLKAWVGNTFQKPFFFIIFVEIVYIPTALNY